MKKLMTYSLLVGAGFSSLSTTTLNSPITTEAHVAQGLPSDFSQKVSDGDFSATINQKNNLLTIEVDLPGLDIARLNLQVVPDNDTKHPLLVGMQEELVAPAVEVNTPAVSPQALEVAEETLQHSKAEQAPQKEKPTGFVLMLPQNVVTDSMQIDRRSQSISITFNVVIADDSAPAVDSSPAYDIEGGVMIGEVDQSLMPSDQPVPTDAPAPMDETVMATDADVTPVDAAPVTTEEVTPDAAPVADETSVAQDATPASMPEVAIVVPVQLNVTIVEPSDMLAVPADSTTDVTPAVDATPATDAPAPVETDSALVVDTAASDADVAPVSDVVVPMDVTVDAVPADVTVDQPAMDLAPVSDDVTSVDTTVVTQEVVAPSDEVVAIANQTVADAAVVEPVVNDQAVMVESVPADEPVTVTIDSPVPVDVVVNAPAEDGEVVGQ